jgi:hypothetical protein
MFTLRCTQKLLTRLKVEPETDPGQADTVLGDWYANLVRVGRAQVVLAVSERTLLPLVIPAKDSRTLVQRLAHALEPVLVSLNVPAEEAIAERQAMQHVAIGKTTSRRVLGSLNDLVFQLQSGLTNLPDRTLLDHSLWLARTPMKLIEYGAPDQATTAAFTAQRTLSKVSRR